MSTSGIVRFASPPIAVSDSSEPADYLARLAACLCLGLHAAHAELNSTAILQIVLLTFPMNLVGCGLTIFMTTNRIAFPLGGGKFGGPSFARSSAVRNTGCLAMMPLVVLGACLTRHRDNIVATISLVVAWLYSVPPLRLKERPPLDSLANGFGYFLLPLMMGYCMGSDPREMPARYYLLALCVSGFMRWRRRPTLRRIARPVIAHWRRRLAGGLPRPRFCGVCLSWLFGDFDSVAVRVSSDLLAGAGVAALVPGSL